MKEELTFKVECGVLLVFLQHVGRIMRGLVLEGGSLGHGSLSFLSSVPFLFPFLIAVSLISLGIQTTW